MEHTICIIGLGLMGASLSQALHGFRQSHIVGVDNDADVRAKALERGFVHEAGADIAAAAQGADLLVFCVYARHIPSLLRRCLPVMKPGCVITDICGVKGALYREILPALPEGVDYIGIHPMAGKEKDGIDNASATLYQNSSMLICPTPSSSQAALALMKDMAHHIRCVRIEVVPYAEHDAIIAYTSELMHIASAMLCAHYHPGMNLAFTAGAYRDCTRIADINAEAWAELLLENRQNTLAALDTYIDDLQRFRAALLAQDEPEMIRLLAQAGNNKREMLRR